MSNNDKSTITKINLIQTEEKFIVKKIIDKFYLIKMKKKETELLKNIIISFIDINERFEYIKKNIDTLSSTNPKIYKILDDYLKSIKYLKKLLL